MASRHEARRRAVDILYEADVSGIDPAEAMAQHASAGEDLAAFTREIVVGVAADIEGIDATIGAAAEGWTVARLAAVDRAVLRVACFELAKGDVSTAVAINEAVEMVKGLSTDESAGFVNGVLGRIARERS